VRRSPARRLLWAWPVSAALLSGCWDMVDGARIKPLEANAFFADGRSSRDPPPGTVPRDAVAKSANRREDFEGAKALPVPLTRGLLERGREQYDIYCSVCHGATGYGDGMIVRRGFTAPPSFHTPLLRQATLGHFVDAVTNGRGAMYSYADRVPLGDRWAIAAYIRALQLSQHAELKSLGEEDARRAREASR
jgi:mono/diheme cytochrome c family protein